MMSITYCQVLESLSFEALKLAGFPKGKLKSCSQNSRLSSDCGQYDTFSFSNFQNKKQCLFNVAGGNKWIIVITMGYIK